MPNPTQRELLDSFIAEEGIYFTTIQEDEVFNLGTKILYLERAISQNCQDFLQSLDKLYAPDLGGEAKTANIEFIRALKLINDCCFNNQVKYGQYGTRATLTHFFGSLGEIDPGDFQTTVQTIINQQIAALREGHLEEVTSQKTARETAETDIARQTGWRAELDLPVTQHHHLIQPVAPQHHHLIQPVAPQAIPSNVTYVADFITLPRAQVIDIYRNNEPNFDRISNLKCYIKNHIQNTNPHAALSLEQAFELTPQETSNLATCYPYVSSQDLSIEEVKTLSEDERQILMVQGSAEIKQQSLANLRQYQEQANSGNALGH